MSLILESGMIADHRVAQNVVGDMGVDFCRAHTGMAQHHLDSQKVGATFQEVGRKTVAEGVRTDAFLDAVLLGKVFHDEENHLPCQRCAAAVEKDRISEFWLYIDVDAGSIDVLEKYSQTVVANRDKPFLVAFSDDSQETIVFKYVADLQYCGNTESINFLTYHIGTKHQPYNQN